MSNRVIKFRAWYDGRMIKESFCEYLSGYGCMFNQFTKPDALMQFTGLHDKNGVEIYEGDVVSSPHFKDKSGRNHVLKHQVIWSEKFQGWVLLNCKSNDENEGSVQMWIAKGVPIEVIGNIYENPELLERTK